MNVLQCKPEGGLYGNDWWVIVKNTEGLLFAGRLEADTEAAALKEAETCDEGFEAVAICEYIHPAYNRVDRANFVQAIADRVLEYAKEQLGIDYATHDNPPKPADWVG